MPAWFRWTAGLAVFALIAGGPFAYFRANYTHAKRLREVTPGRFYRCGQLTADGFRDAVRQYGIRTVINLQDEDPDPLLKQDLFRGGRKVHESEVCRELGVRYVILSFDLPPRPLAPKEPPKAIAEFLKVLDDPSSYPVLLHCKAGLHRTGLLTAVYRMEYEGWPLAEAVRELKANGFGDSVATSANDYVYAYLELYQPRRPRQPAGPGGAGDAVGPRAKGEGTP